MTRIGGAESAAVPDSAAIHFSTQQLPPAERLPALRDLFDRSVQLEIDAEPDHAVEMTMALVPGVRRARMLSSLTARMSRPKPMLADGEDTVCLMVKTGGHLAVRQGRREGVPQVGDGVLLVYREPASLQFVKASHLSVRVPFSALALASNVSAAAARCIPRDTEALSLLRAYVANMPDRVADLQLARLYATHVYDLISLAIGATEEGRRHLQRVCARTKTRRGSRHADEPALRLLVGHRDCARGGLRRHLLLQPVLQTTFSDDADRRPRAVRLRTDSGISIPTRTEVILRAVVPTVRGWRGPEVVV